MKAIASGKLTIANKMFKLPHLFNPQSPSDSQQPRLPKCSILQHGKSKILSPFHAFPMDVVLSSGSSTEGMKKISKQNFPFELKSKIHNRDHSSTQESMKVTAHDKDQLFPFRFYYPSGKIFSKALELFNKQMESSLENSGCSKKPHQRWECKGEIRVSLQMCVWCKDMGKVRSHTDKYYIDVMEVKKYRTILCKGCLGHVLYKQVGNCPTQIQKKLGELDASL